MTHRERMDERHEAIRSNVVRMAETTNEMFRLAIQAVVQNDFAIVESVIASDDLIDRLEKETTAEVIQCIAMQAPVASDLRFLTTTLGIVGEIEKAADHAVKLCRRARKISGRFPGEMKLALTELSDQARKLLAGSIKLYTNYCPEVAECLIRDDEIVDKQFSQVRRTVLDMIAQNPDDTELLVRTINLFQAAEHIADQAVAIAKRIQLCYQSEEELSSV
jgi:phosphate transport system protein